MNAMNTNSKAVNFGLFGTVDFEESNEGVVVCSSQIVKGRKWARQVKRSGLTAINKFKVGTGRKTG